MAETRPRRQKQCVEWEITNKHNEHTVRHITTKQQGCYRPQRAVFKDFAKPFTPFYCWTTATIRRWQSTRKLLSAAITLLLIQQCTIWNNLTQCIFYTNCTCYKWQPLWPQWFSKQPLRCNTQRWKMLKRGWSFSGTFKDLDQIPWLSIPGKCDFKFQGLSRVGNNPETHSESTANVTTVTGFAAQCNQQNTHIHTHTPVQLPFVWDYPGEPVPER